MIDSHAFRSMSISPTPTPTPHCSNKAISNFKLRPWNYKVNVMGEVKGQGHIIHPVSNRYTSFSFNINGTNHSWDMFNRVFDLEKTHRKFSKKIWKKKFPTGKLQSLINITRGISLPSLVVIGWVVLTLSCRQANLCSSMSQPWPWVKVTKRSSSTFSQTYTFFDPNI